MWTGWNTYFYKDSEKVVAEISGTETGYSFSEYVQKPTFILSTCPPAAARKHCF
jgi:hypothetical protein